MATSYTGLRVQDTYNAIIKIGDNSNLTGTPKLLSDGLGNDSPLYLSGTRLGIGISPAYQFHTSGNAKIGGDVIISGDLTVNGDLTYLNVTDLAVEDPLIKLAKDNASNTLDIGFFGKYVESSTTKYTGLFWDASTDKFRLFEGLQDEPTTTVDPTGTGYTRSLLNANLEGNVTGTVSSLSNHDTNDLVEGSVNLYFTTNRARASFSAGTGVTITNGEIAIGQDVATDSNVTFGDITGSAISGTTGTFSSNTSITGDTTTPHSDNAFIVYRGSDGSTALRVQNSGEVVVQNNYLYASGAGTSLYVQNGAVIRGNISNDGGNVSVADNLDVTGNVDVDGNVNIEGGQLKIEGDFAKLLFVDTAGTDEDAYIVNNANGLFFGKTNTPSASNDIFSLNLSTSIATFAGQVIIPETPTADAHAASKKYVDDNSGGDPDQTLAEVLATGNASGANDIIMADDQKIYFGDNSDLFIVHNDTNGVIENIKGNLVIQNKADDSDIIFRSDNGSGDIIEYFRVDGSTNTIPFGRSPHITDNVKLYFGNDTANDASIKWDSTASELFIDGESKFLDNLAVVGAIKDSDGDAGTSGQVLSSTGTGTNWIDLVADVAKRIDVTVKNVSGGSLAKGTVVHAAPTATPPGCY